VKTVIYSKFGGTAFPNKQCKSSANWKLIIKGHSSKPKPDILSIRRICF